jgi:hypothetical protein
MGVIIDKIFGCFSLVLLLEDVKVLEAMLILCLVWCKIKYCEQMSSPSLIRFQSNIL